MPTINFKNATGTFTYEETAVPPEGGGGTPPPTTEIIIPEARITGFAASNGATFNIGGVPFFVENANKSWSLKQIDDRTLRFEVHSGDHFTSSHWNDPTTSERSEVSSQNKAVLVPSGGTMLLQHNIMFEPGPPTKTGWNVFSQMHGTTQPGSPPYAIELYDDKMHINIGMQQNQFVYKDPQRIERGRWYTIQTEAKWDQHNGFLKVKRDGVQIVNYTGPLGENDPHYLKFGIYRYETPETIAVQYRDVTLKVS